MTDSLKIWLSINQGLLMLASGTSRLERDAATLDDPGTCMDLLEYVVIRRSTSRSSSLESQNARHCSGSYKKPIWEVRLQRNQLAFWYANVEMIF
jgi:hypothetical protein